MKRLIYINSINIDASNAYDKAADAFNDLRTIIEALDDSILKVALEKVSTEIDAALSEIRDVVLGSDLDGLNDETAVGKYNARSRIVVIDDGQEERLVDLEAEHDS